MKAKKFSKYLGDLIIPTNQLYLIDLYKILHPKTAGKKAFEWYIGYIPNQMTICLIIKQFHKFKMNEIIQIYIFDYRFSILDNSKW